MADHLASYFIPSWGMTGLGDLKASCTLFSFMDLESCVGESGSQGRKSMRLTSISCLLVCRQRAGFHGYFAIRPA